MTQVCNECNQELQLEDFFMGKNHVSKKCKKCYAEIFDVNNLDTFKQAFDEVDEPFNPQLIRMALTLNPTIKKTPELLVERILAASNPPQKVINLPFIQNRGFAKNANE